MESISLDATDLRLLDALQRDASPSNQQLAADLGISPPTCLRRVQRLRTAGLIDREIALLSTDRLSAVLRARCKPPLCTATPQESYPRYSSRWSPCTSTGTMLRWDAAPTMPHMRSLLSGNECSHARGEDVKRAF